MAWHYTDAVDDVKRLKREGRVAEAEALLLRCVDATEAESSQEGWSPAPWYFHELAVIYRQQGDSTKEVAILERYLATIGVEQARHNKTGSKIVDRLEKARALLMARESMPSSFCPYCGVEIAPMPKKSRSCPTCGEKVMVGKRVGEESPSLMTVEQAEENARQAGQKRSWKKAQERAHKLGYGTGEMEEMSAHLASKWGQQPSPRDLVWALSNKAVRLAGRQLDWAAMSRAYQVQGDILAEEGRPTLLVDQQAREALLRYYEGVCLGVGLPPEVVISTRKGCCPECAERSGEVLPIADALASKALPNQRCSSTRCLCAWRVDYGKLRDQS